MTPDHPEGAPPLTTANEPDGRPLEADLGSATDEEWLAAHEALVLLLAAQEGEPAIPDHELTFIWDPDLHPSTLVDFDEVDHGPSYVDSGEPVPPSQEATDGTP